MYIEVWQLWFLGFLIVAAYFSYKSGWREGFRNGMEMVIFDLHARRLISKHQNEETGELTVGPYNGKAEERND